ncbi:hypothetical protein QO062_07555 [Fervidobacterium pennivorans subsp. carthaginiensis]|jgi:hypothetical protein|uniref:hypothetical protein n=1 Tax=Fervidobacterium pennivorans TaxID=93466 RepID=UPI001436B30D|nr:hypothetical protein [Fervidobacterium pennivorans]QIV77970.1 hypothetical protein HER11_02555 [Fervidobacterium pennivorans subsp. keratinolyticus]
MKQKNTFAVALIVTLLAFSSLTFGNTSVSKVFVFINTENFIGVELRMWDDSYSCSFAEVGVSYLSIGFRLSSKHTQGLYISPSIYLPYSSILNLRLSVGYNFKISGINNITFSLEAGGKELLDKPKSFVNFAIYIPF